MPFGWIMTWTNGQSTIKLTDVRPNVPIDERAFAMQDVAQRYQLAADSANVSIQCRVTETCHGNVTDLSRTLKHALYDRLDEATRGARAKAPALRRTATRGFSPCPLPGLSQLSYSGARLLGLEEVGIGPATDDVAMGIDESGHRGHAMRVDDTYARSGRRLTHRDDAATADDDGLLRSRRRCRR
jgi:hypothetical protein